MKMLASNDDTSGESDEETYDSEKDPEYVLTPRVRENCKFKKNLPINYLVIKHFTINNNWNA